MSQSSTIFRSNNNSSFYSALKSRSSVLGGKGCSALYTFESQTCPSCRSKVIATSANSAGFDRKIQIPLANFGLLSKLFLRAEFTAASNSPTASVGVGLTENVGAFLFNEARLVLDGNVIARLTPEYICARYYRESHDEKRRAFRQLVGGWQGQANNKLALHHNKDSPLASARTGHRQNFYCPLPFWFDSDESISRALDLSVLNQCFLELDINTQDYCIGSASTSAAKPELATLEAVQYLLELDPVDEREFRSISYPVGGSMSQIGYNITQHIEHGLEHHAVASGGTASAERTIKLNMFSGQISKLWVICMDETNNESDSAVGTTKVRNHFKPAAVESIVLTATGTEIYKMERLSDNEKELENWVNGIYSTPPGAFGHVNSTTNLTTSTGNTGTSWDMYPQNTALAISNATTSTGTAFEGGSQISYSSVSPNNIYCINFKEVGGDQRKTSATGSLSFGALSVPNLKIKISGTAGNDYGGNVEPVHSTTNMKAILIAEEIVLYNYITSSTGRTTLQMINGT